MSKYHLLFVWGNLQKLFAAQSAKSQILTSLWKQSSGDSVNSPGTLPMDIASKEEIYAEVAAKNGPSTFLKVSQGVSYAKELIKFYKHGVSVVWQNNKKARHLRRQKYKTREMNHAGDTVDVILPSFPRLTKSMSQTLYMNFIENRTNNENTASEVVRAGEVARTYDNDIFRISRAEYQLLRRTPRDFIKIPMFAVLSTIFMEMTPILCYAFPEVTPSTCVLPSILPRIWSDKAGQRLRTEISAHVQSVEDYAAKTAYNMPLKHVQMLADVLKLKSKYIPLTMYPESVLRARLQDYYNYLMVDNYYLSGLNGDGNVWDLDIQELVRACLERNLVEDIGGLVKTQSLGSREARLEQLELLRLKLFELVVNFQRCNIGYLAIGHMLPAPDVQTIQGWRK